MAGKEYINKILYKYCFKKQIWFKKQNTFVFIIDIYNYKKKGSETIHTKLKLSLGMGMSDF